ncbi:helix-turn-helix transcriptional regulator [bacterium]|nr:helix-turn-helix transcriptional regulator [bacterium]
MRLTPRERDIITLVAEGFADKEIAKRLVLSPRTVQTHLTSVILKFKARNRTHAVALFVKAKYTRKKI